MGRCLSNFISMKIPRNMSYFSQNHVQGCLVLLFTISLTRNIPNTHCKMNKYVKYIPWNNLLLLRNNSWVAWTQMTEMLSEEAQTQRSTCCMTSFLPSPQWIKLQDLVRTASPLGSWADTRRRWGFLKFWWCFLLDLTTISMGVFML
jgi:hypothetical protein